MAPWNLQTRRLRNLVLYGLIALTLRARRELIFWPDPTILALVFQFWLPGAATIMDLISFLRSFFPCLLPMPWTISHYRFTAMVKTFVIGSMSKTMFGLYCGSSKRVLQERFTISGLVNRRPTGLWQSVS